MNKIFYLAISFSLLCTTAEAAFTIKNGTIVDADVVPTMALQDHYDAGMLAVQKKDWYEVVRQFDIVSSNAPQAPIGQEAFYWLGVGYFHLEDYDFANQAFTDYLKKGNNPEFFQQTVEYKYMIAEKFRNGAKRHPFGTKQLPKWMPGIDMSVEIYDEVIAAMPSGDMAACAMYAKGWLLWTLKDYRGSTDSFQLLIKRFPKHHLAPECYVMITHIYLDQAYYEFQNPDLLAFAQMAAKKFRQEFPRDERLEKADDNVMHIKELYAFGLYETGRFYERTCNPSASVIYYQNTISQFPDTYIAQQCRERLAQLCPEVLVNEANCTSLNQEKPSS